MDRKGKGKQIAGAGSSSGKKRKGGGGVEFRDEGLRINSKRKKPGVLQFFEESAEVGYYGGSSDEECDMDDLFNGNFVFFLSCMRFVCSWMLVSSTSILSHLMIWVCVCCSHWGSYLVKCRSLLESLISEIRVCVWVSFELFRLVWDSVFVCTEIVIW